MGMYDSILFKCEECGSTIEAQSKGGECMLKKYSPDAVPIDVAGDADRHAPFICKCGAVYTLEAPAGGYVQLRVNRIN